MSEAECHCGQDGHALNSVNCPEHGRFTRQEAEDLVWDLLQAVSNRDNFPTKPTYQHELEEIRLRVVSALMTACRSPEVSRPNLSTPEK